jgi:hypothetical protein
MHHYQPALTAQERYSIDCSHAYDNSNNSNSDNGKELHVDVGQPG